MLYVNVYMSRGIISSNNQHLLINTSGLAQYCLKEGKQSLLDTSNQGAASIHSTQVKTKCFLACQMSIKEEKQQGLKLFKIIKRKRLTEHGKKVGAFRNTAKLFTLTSLEQE